MEVLRKPVVVLGIIALLGVGLIVTLQLGGSDDEVTGPRIADAIDDISGSWQAVDGSAYHHFGADGNHQWGHSPNDLNAKLDEDPEGQFWFEDGVHFHTNQSCGDVGAYEITIAEDGTMTFAVVDDACSSRARWLSGRGGDRIWTRIEG